jgi:spore maturation protein SpmA
MVGRIEESLCNAPGLAISSLKFVDLWASWLSIGQNSGFVRLLEMTVKPVND